MSVMPALGGPVPHPINVVNVHDPDAQSGDSRSQPGMGITGHLIFRKDTGGERWVQTPTAKQA